jgi:hypothetical protein
MQPPAVGIAPRCCPEDYRRRGRRDLRASRHQRAAAFEIEPPSEGEIRLRRLDIVGIGTVSQGALGAGDGTPP